ncbi:predicted protein [Sclerotinia sclerotiorum 1980 UF-70]|uniref:Uncharacterized protein n=2 Tax=Sclerotinia sclerotiorum (strain ATCC 18683 / 1980 / Ss-1) TaxID=665079 RepID=A7F1H6_SCLS1|nr:predicted protein [Sclerotinia sclerotiorum 1980 UF-70]APA11229.1 hypothetical protein sscle_07g059990 [Sclerotinia sclerotiorum 1980 UF-70]EDN95568.1 predicted protein [Sclerotinia sclerotiorum 1980 UF-70]
MDNKNTIAALQAKVRTLEHEAARRHRELLKKNALIAYLEIKLDIARRTGRDIVTKPNRFLPNIPILEIDDYGKPLIAFDDWLDSMQAFLFGDEVPRASHTAYIEFHLGSRLLERVGNKYGAAEEILGKLGKTYSSPSRRKAVMNQYEGLVQKDGAPIHTIQQRISTTARHRTRHVKDVMVRDLKEKLNRAMKLALRASECKNIDVLAMTCTMICAKASGMHV